MSLLDDFNSPDAQSDLHIPAVVPGGGYSADATSLDAALEAGGGFVDLSARPQASIFALHRVDYSPPAPIAALAVCNNIVAMATAAPSVVRLSLADPAATAEIMCVGAEVAAGRVGVATLGFFASAGRREGVDGRPAATHETETLSRCL